MRSERENAGTEEGAPGLISAARLEGRGVDVETGVGAALILAARVAARSGFPELYTATCARS